MTASDQIKLALDDIGPMSSLELRRLLGFKQTKAQKYIRELREAKQIHILRNDHQPDGTRGRFVPVYAIGEGAAPPQVRPVTNAIRNRRYRQRHAAIISARRYPHVRQAAGVWAGLMQ